MLGFLLQSRLVFRQTAQLFPSDFSKVSYPVGLLWGKVLVWAQVLTSHCLGVGGEPKSSFLPPRPLRDTFMRLLSLRQ